MGSHKIQLPILLFTWASLACLCFSLPCEYSILDHDLPNFPSEEVVVELFQQWMEKHKKVYKDAEEVVKRFENFRNSLKYIIEKNAERTSPNGYCLGLNSFSDMSNEEFRQVYLMSEMKQPFNQKGNTLISKNVQQNLQFL
ncbi:Papaya proteinase 4 [Morella rubra]|uniref:Papaya proteinase 4 n=1 Tax=Morella rubra TaxID=262757 RepID=A0A6A1VEE4_9ROSI|nr:Papaya proteinase 4 [Morella rubra]